MKLAPELISVIHRSLLSFDDQPWLLLAPLDSACALGPAITHEPAFARGILVADGIKPRQLASVRSLHLAGRVIKARSAQLPFPEGTMRGFIALDMLERGPAAELLESGRQMLRKGGELIIAQRTPAPGPRRLWRKIVGHGFVPPPPEELTCLMLNHDFSDVRQQWPEQAVRWLVTRGKLRW